MTQRIAMSPSRARAVTMLFVVMEGSRSVDAAFRDFFSRAEPRLRRALAAGYGPAAGREAALEALVWAWQHWGRVEAMDNPVGYLYRVGQTAAQRQLARRERDRYHAGEADSTVGNDDIDAERLDLTPALAELSIQQRTAVTLVHGYGLSLRETAELMEVSVSTVREHAARAITHLRVALEVTDDTRSG